MQVHHTRWPTTFQPQGFRITYRFGTINYCPGCGGSHWHIGRSSAQCAFCATAVPFAAGMPEARAA
jgi:hypothetical protein